MRSIYKQSGTLGILILTACAGSPARTSNPVVQATTTVLPIPSAIPASPSAFAEPGSSPTLATVSPNNSTSASDPDCASDQSTTERCDPTPVATNPPAIETKRFEVTSYRGRPLPQANAAPDAAPAAWLIIGDQVIQATYGSQGTANVLPSPEAIARASLPPNAKTVIVIDSGPIKTLSVTSGPPPQQVSVTADTTAPTAWIMEPLAIKQAQLLYVLVRFDWSLGADASYIWALTPSEP